MKKNTLILLLIILFLGIFLSCRQKIKIIPEITPHIIEEVIYDLKDKEPVGQIIKNDAKLIFVTLKGEIFRLDPDKKILDFLYKFNMDIDPEIFTQNNFVVLKQHGSNNYIIFNLTSMQVEKKVTINNLDRMIGLDNDLFIYKNKANLLFLDYRNGKTKEKLKIEENVNVYNSESLGHSFLVLTSRNLYTYYKSKNAVDTLAMKVKPASDFLLDQRCIYFGSENRELVKFSLKSGKVKWKFRIPEILKVKPQKINRYITITPEDNNIYFFNTRGTLHWWTSFDSPRALPVIVMKKNAAVFLMNREYRRMNNKIRFYDYKKKEVVSYEFKYQLESNPVYLNNYLYLLSKDEEKGVKNISRIGNRYDVEIEIDPKNVKPLGKAITFAVKPINLIDPQARIKILKNDNSQDNIFNKELGKDQDLSFVWIPEEPGSYKIVLEMDAENKKELKTEKDFEVVDIDRIVKQYYYELQRDCPKEFLKEKRKDVEKLKQEGEKGKRKGKGKRGKRGKREELDKSKKDVEERVDKKKKSERFKRIFK